MKRQPAPQFQTPHPTGFTLMEVVVGLGIVGVLMTLVLANFRQPYRFKEAPRAAQEFADLLRAQQIRIAAGEQRGQCAEEDRLCDVEADCAVASCVPGVPIGGYGVAVTLCTSNCSFSSFADLTANGAMAVGEEIQTINLGKLITSGIAIGHRDLQNGGCEAPVALGGVSQARVVFLATTTRVFVDAAVVPDACSMVVEFTDPSNAVSVSTQLSVTSGYVTVTP